MAFAELNNDVHSLQVWTASFQLELLSTIGSGLHQQTEQINVHKYHTGRVSPWHGDNTR